LNSSTHQTDVLTADIPTSISQLAAFGPGVKKTRCEAADAWLCATARAAVAAAITQARTMR